MTEPHMMTTTLIESDSTDPAKPPARGRRWALHRIGSATLLLSAFAAARAGEPPVYSFGVVPQFDARTTFDIWSPILAQLQVRTGLRFQLLGSPSIPMFERQFHQQEFDFAYMNPYHAVLAASSYVPLVRDVATRLEGIIVVRKDSPIQSLRELQGKTMDFPAPNALAASLMTRALLDQLGVAVQPRYVKTHSSVYLNVALGQADAGGGVRQTLDEQPPAVRERLRVIDKTVAVASHPMVANKRISAAVREGVRAALLDLGETADGRALLKKIPIDQVGRAAAEDYVPLQHMGLGRFYVTN